MLTPGQTPSPSLIKSLLSSRPDTSAGVNFTQFLSMMGEHLLELDPEHDLLEAFACFDEGDKGWVDVKEMRKWLNELGDRMNEQEVGAPSVMSDRSDGSIVQRAIHRPPREIQLCGMGESAPRQRRRA